MDELTRQRSHKGNIFDVFTADSKKAQKCSSETMSTGSDPKPDSEDTGFDTSNLSEIERKALGKMRIYIATRYAVRLHGVCYNGRHGTIHLDFLSIIS